VWLEYSGAGSRRVYERVGFRPGGTRVYLRHEG
ncbi:GNAT family N-acetyltransferase, partial [Streptomyces sp. SID685]|nr:GNAT family N-acetyltransferase [Streptomyces sp. SID685]